MKPQVEARFFQCPVDAGLALMAGKWKPRILWKLYRYQTVRFGQLKRLLPDITDKMLTQQLRELEADGLITRRVYPVVPPRVEYTFSAFGKTLEPVIAAIANWGETYETEIRAHLEPHNIAPQESS